MLDLKLAKAGQSIVTEAIDGVPPGMVRTIEKDKDGLFLTFHAGRVDLATLKTPDGYTGIAKHEEPEPVPQASDPRSPWASSRRNLVAD